jgi:hypothetical protein
LFGGVRAMGRRGFVHDGNRRGVSAIRDSRATP